MKSHRDRIAGLQIKSYVREYRKRILIVLFNISKGNRDILEFESISPYYYRCPYSQKGACVKGSNRSKEILDYDKGMNGQRYKESSLVVLEEGIGNSYLFILNFDDNNLDKSYYLKIENPCKCLFNKSQSCTTHKRVIYMDCVNETYDKDHISQIRE